MTTRIKLRRDTASNWSDVNPTLALGEAGYDTTNNQIRIGDGEQPWSALSPIGGALAAGMLSNLRYGNNPQITNDTQNPDANYMYFEVQTQWDQENYYGRTTVGWHDSDNPGLYNRIVCDPYGTTIKANNWTSGYAHNWHFNQDGTTSMPGTVLNATVTKTTSPNETIEIDLAKTVNKLTPTQTLNTGNGIYHLADGSEGQVMHLVVAGSTDSTEYTGINIDNARWGNGNDILEGTRLYWLPFYDPGTGRKPMVTIVFTDGYWNLPHGSID